MTKSKERINKKGYLPALIFQTRDPGYQTGNTIYKKTTKLNP